MSRPGANIVYADTYKMLLRGLLFNAPESIRAKYVATLDPITLGGQAVKDDVIGEALTMDEISTLDEFVKAMQAVPVPSIEDVERDPEIAQTYVNGILKVSDLFIPRFAYFQDDLATITGNIKSRTVILAPILEDASNRADSPGSGTTSPFKERYNEVLKGNNPKDRSEAWEKFLSSNDEDEPGPPV